MEDFSTIDMKNGQDQANCSINFDRLKVGIRETQRRIVRVEDKIKHLPTGFEFRIWCIIILMVYFGTNPSAFKVLKGFFLG